MTLQTPFFPTAHVRHCSLFVAVFAFDAALHTANRWCKSDYSLAHASGEDKARSPSNPQHIKRQREREKGYGLDVSRSQGVCELKPVVPQRRYIRMRPSYLIRQRCYVSISVWICASGYAPPMNVSRRRATDKGKIGPRGKPYFSVAFQQASCIDSSLRLWKEPTKEDSDLRWIRQDSSPSPPLHLH